MALAGGGELVLRLGGTGQAPGGAQEVQLGRARGHLVRPGEWQAAEPAGEQAVLVASVVSRARLRGPVGAVRVAAEPGLPGGVRALRRSWRLLEGISFVCLLVGAS